MSEKLLTLLNYRFVLSARILEVIPGMSNKDNYPLVSRLIGQSQGVAR